MIVKKLKNKTQDVISVFGFTLSPGEVVDVVPQEWISALASSPLRSLVSSGSVAMVDNETELSAAEGLLFLDLLQDPNTLPVRKQANIQFSFNSEMDYDQYLVSWADSDTNDNRLKRSSTSQGLRNGDACPIVSTITGKVISATVCVVGAAVSTGNPASEVELLFELWNSGFTNEGSKIGDILVNIDTSQNPVGNWWNSWGEETNLAVQIPLQIPVSSGDRLALKFIRQQANDKVVEVRGTNVGITLLEDL